MKDAGSHEASKQTLLLWFVKHPASGRVKTRLAQTLGAETATRLYRAFVADMRILIEESGLPVWVCHDPSHSETAYRRWLDTHWPLLPQQGQDLGQRMAHAFQTAFGLGYGSAILMGSDLPDLPPEFLEQAVRALQEHKMLLGPTADGGYYLIAFRSEAFLTPAFHNISWSSPHVLNQTLSACRQAGCHPHLLEQWWDVDSEQDLKLLAHRCQHRPERARATLDILADLAKQRVIHGGD